MSYFNHSFTDNDKAFIEHMKDMNQLNENQAFKMVINAADYESQDDLEAVETYVSDALRQVHLQSDILLYQVEMHCKLKIRALIN